MAYIQFVKTWATGESNFIEKLQEAGVYKTQLYYYRGGKGFYNAGEISAKGVTEQEHKKAAKTTFKIALDAATSGKYDVVICDEINNAVHDGLLSINELRKLISDKAEKTSLCLTGRNFPEELLPLTDIATNMLKIKHHFDDKFLANEGIDY